MKILIIDDELFMLNVYKYLLEEEGYRVTINDESQHTIELIVKESPDILLLDIMMPYVSGMELLDLIKNKLFMDLPVIIISGADDQEIKDKAYELGADGFIVKPVDPGELKKTVERVLR